MCEGADPAAVLCVAYTQGLPNDIDEILSDDSPVINREQATHAIFYSVFRTSVDTDSRNLGADLVLSAAEIVREKNPNVTNFVTMSPIPNLRKYFADIPVIDSVVHFLEELLDPVARFHISNGAKIMRVIADADASDRRQDQSWGFMVNYDYTETLSKS
jgi:malonyl-CoA decarboxylase